MNSFLNYLLESGFALGAFSLFYLLALKQEKSFVFNRFYLLGAVVLSLFLPLIHFSLESVPADFVMGTIMMQTTDLSASPNTSNFFTVSNWIWAYGIVVGLLLIKLARKIVFLLIKRKDGIAIKGYKIYHLKESLDAYTFLDTIYLGDQLKDREKELILSHEKNHARGLHSLDILLLEIIGAFLWINPMLPLITKWVRTNHEYLADAKAVCKYSKETYVQTLATHTLSRHGFELAHSFYNSSTLKRIKMLNQQNNQIMKIKQIIPFILGLALVIVFGCEDATEQLSGLNDQEAAKTIVEYQESIANEIGNIEGVYDMVDVQPGPKGGMTTFYEWVAATMEYPTQAKKDGIEGRVFVQFIVNETGDITEVKSIKGIGGGCDAEAVRVMQSAAKWTPGQKDGQPVKVRMIMPVSFKLRG
ncbi:MAG: M56 family metallopeptidase [Reichenbachiella sp.]|uniref:M56 family metallopeptidase n=1 Tax=Reichenbachiella sp. TaxID=2184521 RepID=UPI00329930A1